MITYNAYSWSSVRGNSIILFKNAFIKDYLQLTSHVYFHTACSAFYQQCSFDENSVSLHITHISRKVIFLKNNGWWPIFPSNLSEGLKIVIYVNYSTEHAHIRVEGVVFENDETSIGVCNKDWTLDRCVVNQGCLLAFWVVF